LAGELVMVTEKAWVTLLGMVLGCLLGTVLGC
jgi:hypothetical protein